MSFVATFIKYLPKKWLELNSDWKAILKMSKPHVITAALYAKLLQCQATSFTVERSFSMLYKLLAKDRYLVQGDLWKSYFTCV